MYEKKIENIGSFDTYDTYINIKQLNFNILKHN
jgi:hypothetical protein